MSVSVITAFGLSMPASQWAKNPACKVSAQVLTKRIKDGWAPERAITLPARGTPKPRYSGGPLPKGVVGRRIFHRYRSCIGGPAKCLANTPTEAATAKDVAVILRRGPAGMMSRQERFHYYKKKMEELGYRVPVIC